MRNGTYVWYTPLKCLCVMVHMFVTIHLNVCALCLWVMWFCLYSPFSIFVPQPCYYVCYSPLKCLCMMFVLDVCALCLWVMWFCFYSPSSIFVPQLCYQDMIVKQGLADLESFAFLFFFFFEVENFNCKVFDWQPNEKVFLVNFC